MKNESQIEHYKKMTETPVHKLILKLCIPTILSMLVSNIYNLVDTAFVGKLGNSASGAVHMGTSGSILNINGSTGISRLSNSTDTTDAPVIASAWVRVPMPGPISSTVSSGVSSAVLAIRLTTDSSTKKFCPRFLSAFK